MIRFELVSGNWWKLMADLDRACWSEFIDGLDLGFWWLPPPETIPSVVAYGGRSPESENSFNLAGACWHFQIQFLFYHMWPPLCSLFRHVIFVLDIMIRPRFLLTELAYPMHPYIAAISIWALASKPTWIASWRHPVQGLHPYLSPFH